MLFSVCQINSHSCFLTVLFWLLQSGRYHRQASFYAGLQLLHLFFIGPFFYLAAGHYGLLPAFYEDHVALL